MNNITRTKIDAIRHDIETSFANVPYPGDANIAIPQHEYDFDREKTAAFFQRKSWKQLSRLDINEHNASLFMFSPDGFRYYLPAYLLGSLELSKFDNLINVTVSCLTPNFNDPVSIAWFLARADKFNLPQCISIQRFLALLKEEEIYRRNQAILDISLNFWASKVSLLTDFHSHRET